MKIDRGLFDKIDTYAHAVLSWVDDDGYPVQTPAYFNTDAEAGVVRIEPAGTTLPLDREVNFIVSHIRPKPGEGYDQRRYVSLWGRLNDEGGMMALRPERAWGWDEKEVHFFEYSERSNPQAKRYLQRLSLELGKPVRPRLSATWTFLLATRLPFLTATFVPILLGIAIAAKDGHFVWGLAILTVIAGAAVHIGLNVANDIFDTLSGADEINVNATQFSGGSRVLQYGLVSLSGMIAISAGAYAVGLGIGIALVIMRGTLELLWLGMAGTLISIFYTAPPLRLVSRGLGEIAVALGFGPIMVLGAYVVQTKALTWEAFIASIPVAILIALVLYVNEIPDRSADAAAGKRTLPVRLDRDLVTNGFLIAALAAFLTVVVAAATGVIPRPALLALVALPLVPKVYQGIRAYYDDPYELMPVMGTNIQLHLLAGLLLFGGYLVAVIAQKVSESPPAILT